jgi:hypothetical protein
MVANKPETILTAILAPFTVASPFINKQFRVSRIFVRFKNILNLIQENFFGGVFVGVFIFQMEPEISNVHCGEIVEDVLKVII